MTKIYELHHYDPEDDSGIDFDKRIGVYSSEALAKAAIERLRDKPGFRECPNGWLIEEVVVDKDTKEAKSIAGEFNGFLKPKARLFAEPLRFAAGELVLAAGYTPTIDADVLATHELARERYSSREKH